ncbi:hypothetical protein CEXT_516081 [Caerostris extrusa]|uniref:Uncharacterized protein n=1 Tax=Caerostris extrusa TaxID=172846 RepID=A0AAV4NJI9_CAEEX|nr:hypothetical protein CEXT_516081 [Caerostris extrusa]
MRLICSSISHWEEEIRGSSCLNSPPQVLSHFRQIWWDPPSLRDLTHLPPKTSPFFPTAPQLRPPNHPPGANDGPAGSGMVANRKRDHSVPEPADEEKFEKSSVEGGGWLLACGVCPTTLIGFATLHQPV